MTADPIADGSLAPRRSADRRRREGHRPRTLYRRSRPCGGPCRAHLSQPGEPRRNRCGLDVSRARALEGVFAVVTGDDCPHTYGVLPVAMNEYPMARERVRYRGEPIAAVAAIDAETAGAPSS